MLSFVVNLERSKDRKEYMETLLAPFSSSLGKIEYIKAVDGKKLSDEEVEKMFSQEQAYKRYGRYLKRGEIGCTLSHRKCFRQLSDSDEQVAFIMEDDIIFRIEPEGFGKLLKLLMPILLTSEPVIVVLFGEYWWTTARKLSPGYKLMSVYEAISAQGYLVNRKAADLLLSCETAYLADDWSQIISQGVKVKALHPHIIDQECMSFMTTISMDGYGSMIKKNMSLKRRLLAYKRGAIKHILKAIGHYDPHQIPKEKPDWVIELGL